MQSIGRRKKEEEAESKSKGKGKKARGLHTSAMSSNQSARVGVGNHLKYPSRVPMTPVDSASGVAREHRHHHHRPLLPLSLDFVLLRLSPPSSSSAMHANAAARFKERAIVFLEEGAEVAHFFSYRACTLLLLLLATIMTTSAAACGGRF